MHSEEQCQDEKFRNRGKKEIKPKLVLLQSSCNHQWITSVLLWNHLPRQSAYWFSCSINKRGDNLICHPQILNRRLLNKAHSAELTRETFTKKPSRILVSKTTTRSPCIHILTSMYNKLHCVIAVVISARTAKTFTCLINQSHYIIYCNYISNRLHFCHFQFCGSMRLRNQLACGAYAHAKYN